MAKVTFLDFWAPWCIDPQTPVLTENGYTSASEIKVGMRLLTLDPETKKQVYKEVEKVRIFENAPSKKIVLETGRQLIGDENHPVLTTEGFKKLSELTTTDKILVNPVRDLLELESLDGSILLQTTGNAFADKFLQSSGLLPLKANDKKLLILARLLGFVVTDGYLYEDIKHNIYETHFFVGTEKDAQDIQKDLAMLGFKNLEIKKRANKRQIEGREFTITTLRCRSFNRSLFFLLKALGSPVGRKKNQTYFIPDWVMSADHAIKSEFLSGWLGGDGCKIDYRIKQGGVTAHDAKFGVNAIEFHKEKGLEREGVLYAQQISSLLEELGVSVKEISSQDDSDGVIISIRVATDYVSLNNLAKIEYAYAQTKNSKIPFIREFLSYRLFERDSYIQVKQIVVDQLALGLSTQSIAQSLQIPYRTVTSWKYNDSKTIRAPKNTEARFDIWLENKMENGLLWEKVKIIEDIEDRDVVGITVGEPHTIITNGIISHNCGPCKITTPIVKELEKEFEGKVEFEEINVDEDPQRSSKFGVMSIPTFVVLKDGVEIGRKIGAMPKAELKKLVESGLS
jgi:intein/homing endonuclease